MSERKARRRAKRSSAEGTGSGEIPMVESEERPLPSAEEPVYHSDPSGSLHNLEESEELEADAAEEKTVTPEEIAALPIMRASDLVQEEEEIPPMPGAEPPPPGNQYGPFIVQDVRGYGDGTRVLILEGDEYQPLGNWLGTRWPDLDSEDVYKLLTGMGLPAEDALRFARQRDGSQHPAVQEMLEDPSSALAQAAVQEEKHWDVKDSFSKAFVEAQRRKQRS